MVELIWVEQLRVERKNGNPTDDRTPQCSVSNSRQAPPPSPPKEAERASPWPKATQQERFGLSFLSKSLPLTPS